MVQAPKGLDDLARRGGCLSIRCRRCGRVAIFSPHEILSYWRAKGWDTSFPAFADHLVCRRPDGCGQRGPSVSWLLGTPPDTDPLPPRPRFTRTSLPQPRSDVVVPMRRRKVG